MKTLLTFALTVVCVTVSVERANAQFNQNPWGAPSQVANSSWNTPSTNHWCGNGPSVNPFQPQTNPYQPQNPYQGFPAVQPNPYQPAVQPSFPNSGVYYPPQRGRFNNPTMNRPNNGPIGIGFGEERTVGGIVGGSQNGISGQLGGQVRGGVGGSIAVDPRTGKLRGNLEAGIEGSVLGGIEGPGGGVVRQLTKGISKGISFGG
jgi:hypothetical protein